MPVSFPSHTSPRALGELAAKVLHRSCFAVASLQPRDGISDMVSDGRGKDVAFTRRELGSTVRHDLNRSPYRRPRPKM